VPALRALARAFPDHRLVLAAPAPLAPLAALTQSVDEVVPAAPLAPLPGELRDADLGVNLHGRGPRSHRVLAAAEPRRTIAFFNAEVPESAGGPRWMAGEHEVERWCRLLVESGVAADPDDLRLACPPPEDPAARGATLIHPGAGAPDRCWPVRNWGAVARAEAAAGRRVFVTGDARERALAERVAEAAGLGTDAVLAGTTDLAELAACVAAANRVACVDTGLGHLATALGTPSVLIFGRASLAEWRPRIDGHLHTVLTAPVEVGEVVEALASLPERPAERAAAALVQG
jgi:ADP-heptose:LPS heptosyltransferase